MTNTASLLVDTSSLLLLIGLRVDHGYDPDFCGRICGLPELLLKNGQSMEINLEGRYASIGSLPLISAYVSKHH